jgi:hypothetical protein
MVHGVMHPEVNFQDCFLGIGNYQIKEVLTKFVFPDVIPYSVIASSPAFSTNLLLPSSGPEETLQGFVGISQSFGAVASIFRVGRHSPRLLHHAVW